MREGKNEEPAATGCDIPEREARFQPGDAGKARELLFMDALEIGEIARHHGDEVVVLARHQMTGNDGRRLDHGLLERLEQILVLALEADLHDDGDAQAERLATDAGLIAFDHAPLFERADASCDRGRRQRNALGKLDLAQTPVLEQGAEDRAIQRVKLSFFHFSASYCHL